MTSFETKVKDWLEGMNWHVIHNGWPDFLAYKWDKQRKNWQYFTIEAKQGNDYLSQDQCAMHTAFGQLGIPAYIVRPESDLDNVTIPAWKCGSALTPPSAVIKSAPDYLAGAIGQSYLKSMYAHLASMRSQMSKLVNETFELEKEIRKFQATIERHTAYKSNLEEDNVKHSYRSDPPPFSIEVENAQIP